MAAHAVASGRGLPTTTQIERTLANRARVRPCAVGHACKLAPCTLVGTRHPAAVMQPTRMAVVHASVSSSPAQGGGGLWGLLPPHQAARLLQSAWQLLTACFWPVIVTYALKDTAAFMLHRVGHRVTNAVAEWALGVDMASVTNRWWLCLDSTFLDGNVGYQLIIAAVFVLCLPINILLNSYALAVIMQVVKQQPGSWACSTPRSSTRGGAGEGNTSTPAQDLDAQQAAGSMEHPTASSAQNPPGSATSTGTHGDSSAGAQTRQSESSEDQSSSGKGILAQLRAALATAASATPTVNGMLMRVWWVDLLFNVQALPLQALSLLVFPLFWTLPRLLAIQLAVPVAVAEGLNGKAAFARSQELMAGFGRAYAWPYVSLLLGIRLLDLLRTFLLSAMPPRYWQEVVEVPIVLISLFAFAKIVVIRMQDMMPVAAFEFVSRSKLNGSDQGHAGSEEPESPTEPHMRPSI